MSFVPGDAELTPEELVEAKRIEVLIEDILEAKYDGTNKPIVVDVGEYIPANVRAWLSKRFTAWNMGYDELNLKCTPK